MRRQEKRDRIEQIKSGISFVKSNLMRESDKLREVSESEANKLDRIIGRLEAWQNS